MSLTDWLLPWRARKRILDLENRLAESEAHKEVIRNELMRVGAANERSNMVAQALAVWIKTAHKK